MKHNHPTVYNTPYLLILWGLNGDHKLKILIKISIWFTYKALDYDFEYIHQDDIIGVDIIGLSVPMSVIMDLIVTINCDIELLLIIDFGFLDSKYWVCKVKKAISHSINFCIILWNFISS